MFARLADRIPFKKIVMVLAIAAGVSFGLCGLAMIVWSGGNLGGNFVEAFWTLDTIILGVSLVGLMLTGLVYVTLSAFGALSGKVSQSPDSPGEQDATRIEKNE